MKSIIIHGLFFGIGLGGAMLCAPHLPTVSSSHPVLKPERTRPKNRTAVGMSLSSPSSFRSAYSDLLHRSMTKSERNSCMEKLWNQWRATNPVDMLAFLEQKRVWPDAFRYSNDLNLSNRPEIMLDFALRNGCSDMLRGLYYSDPSSLASLLDSVPVEQKGTKMIELIEENDRKLGRLGIAMKDPSPAYRRGVAESLLEQGKIDEFLKVFGEVGDHQDMSELARKFGEALTLEKPSDDVLALIFRLPEEYRKDAAYDLMQRGDYYAMKFPEVRDARIQWIEKFAEQGLVEAASKGVSDLFVEEDAASRGVKIAAWVARFPSDGSWQPITEEIFRSWAGSDRDGMIAQICALPQGPVRETLATEAANATIGGRAEALDHDEQMIFDRLANLFTDPKAKERFVKKIAPEDPFAAQEDPFAAPQRDPFAGPDDPFAEKAK